MQHPIFDCLTYLQSVASVASTKGTVTIKDNGLVQACVQAEATRRAGKLTAQASANAGVAATIAGILALAAGWLTVRPIYEERARRRFVFSRELIADLRQLRVHLDLVLRNLSHRMQGGSYFGDTVYAIPISRRLSETSWRQEIPLTREAVISIQRVDEEYALLRRTIAAQQHGPVGIAGESDKIVECRINKNAGDLLRWFEQALNAVNACEHVLVMEARSFPVRLCIRYWRRVTIFHRKHEATAQSLLPPIVRPGGDRPRVHP